ncbi:hypothetical protein [Pseudomonas syringae]|uniref:Uncharacterized protein n=2 Tax=Pseudomonas syringae TaxID=317 RepID=F3FN03_PSESX|nr:hypothetical protein [Pseudomonas syringae]EGH31589.1 hypothetical protein PSYJA_22493 [Pseudomonas syringae pv. japonica str. M301072]EPN48525.1 hypothetical protein A245_29930 [Pseudomonas syringae pv. actinidiae ICMP 19096]EPM48599.1 hypothetical protein A246_10531 [Pseudomonas syringae pv. actinidiae ICMP 19098]EPN35146.1 hypothetical protein A243_10816 [Pseudomonas syringae pv. actinidiae ICMP 18883]MCK9694212.1 hypothetical protein [Pseudomonas syringae pv. syringae]
MKDSDPIAQILERARQRIEQVAIAGDREVMFHSAAEAQGWIGALQAENLLSNEQCEMLDAELKVAVSKWDGGPE